MAKKKTTGKGAIQKHPKPEYSTEWIKVDFTEEELREMADEMAGDIQVIGDLEDNLAAIRSDFQAQIKTKSQNVKELSRKIRNKFEHRNVKVRIVKDYQTKTVFFHNENEDGSLKLPPVKSRPMHPSELQMSLGDVDQSPADTVAG